MEPHEWPDMASELDRPAEIFAEQFSLPLACAEKVLAWHKANVEIEVRRAQGEQLGRIVGVLCGPAKNLRALVRGLALAAGLDELNGTHSQAEVARELGCTRSLISHYVTSWADLLSIDVTKFRKRPEARAVYAQRARATWAKKKGKN